LVLHFLRYFEDAAILQVQVEQGPPHHPQNARATFGFMFLQSLTFLSRTPLLRMYPRWLNIFPFFFMKMSLQIRHFTLL
jgi:hypothetical protein